MPRGDLLPDRIAGCLAAARGAELMAALGLPAPPRRDPRPAENLMQYRCWAIADALLRTYLRHGARLTAWEWGEALKRGDLDPLDASFDYQTSIEVLREGMHPRLTGMYAALTPGGLPLAPVVGLYNLGDSEQAFLDAYDLASVVQRDRGVEGPAVLAAAIAEAACADATVESVVEAIKTALLDCDQDLRRSCLFALGKGARLATQNEDDLEAAREALASIDPAMDWQRCELHPNCLEAALVVFVASAGDLTRAARLLPLVPTYAGMTGFVVGALCGALTGLRALPASVQDPRNTPARRAEKFADLITARFAQEKQTVTVLTSLSKPKKTVEGQEPLLFNKIFGSTLAGALGNSMGSIVECLHYRDIEREYGVIDTVLDPGRLETEDDLQMALHISQAFIEKGGVATSHDLARIWRRDMVPERFFYCMRNAWDLIRLGHNPRFTGHTNFVTGSTLMCMQPVGFYNAGDPAKAFLDALDISYMYQRGLDVDCACTFAAAVAEAVRPGATVKSVCETALEYAPTRKMITFDQRHPDTIRKWLELALEIGFAAPDVFAVREPAYQKLLQYHAIDPLEFFCLTFAVFAASAGKLEQAVMGGTNIGRDADSISSLNGVLTGALHGWEAIPKRWRKLVGSQAMSAFRAASQGMTELVLKTKLPAMQAAQERIPR